MRYNRLISASDFSRNAVDGSPYPPSASDESQIEQRRIGLEGWLSPRSAWVNPGFLPCDRHFRCGLGGGLTLALAAWPRPRSNGRCRTFSI